MKPQLIPNTAYFVSLLFCLVFARDAIGQGPGTPATEKVTLKITGLNAEGKERESTLTALLHHDDFTDAERADEWKAVIKAYSMDANGKNDYNYFKIRGEEPSKKNNCAGTVFYKLTGKGPYDTDTTQFMSSFLSVYGRTLMMSESIQPMDVVWYKKGGHVAYVAAVDALGTIITVNTKVNEEPMLAHTVEVGPLLQEGLSATYMRNDPLIRNYGAMLLWRIPNLITIKVRVFKEGETEPDLDINIANLKSSVEEGEAITVDVSLEKGTPPFRWTWESDSLSAAGTSAKFTITAGPDVVVPPLRTFKVLAWDAGRYDKTPKSKTFTVTVNAKKLPPPPEPDPELDVKIEGPTETVKGRINTYTAKIGPNMGKGKLTCTWSFNGKVRTGQVIKAPFTKPAFAIPVTLSVKDQGKYADDAKEAEPIMVDVYDELDAVVDGPSTAKPGEKVHFTAKILGLGGKPPADFVWTRFDGTKYEPATLSSGLDDTAPASGGKKQVSLTVKDSLATPQQITRTKEVSVETSVKSIHYSILNHTGKTETGDIAGVQGTIPISYSAQWKAGDPGGGSDGHANMRGSIAISPAAPGASAKPGETWVTIKAEASFDNAGLGVTRTFGVEIDGLERIEKSERGYNVNKRFETSWTGPLNSPVGVFFWGKVDTQITLEPQR